MKTFKVFTHQLYIMEAKIDDLKLKYPAISTEHDPHGIHKESGDIIDHFHSHNPTGNIQHTNWMLGQYKKGNIKQEDAKNIKDSLQHFEKYKPKLEKKNIDQYKSVGELHGALQPHIGTNKSDKETELSHSAIKNGSTLVHNDKDVKLYHVHNTDAACELGKGMPWCTSRRDSSNMFNYYNNSTGGKFYVAHLPNESAPHRKIGIGVGAGEFQDENNDRISHSTLTNLVKRNPSLGKVKELQGVRVATTQDVHKHAIDLIHNDNENLEHIKNNPTYDKDKTTNKILGYQHDSTQAENGDADMMHSQHVQIRKKLADNIQNIQGDDSKKEVINKLKNDENHDVRANIIKSRSVPYETRLHMAKHDVSPFVRGNFTNVYDSGHGRDTDELHDMIKKEKHPAVLGAWSQNVHGIDHNRFADNKNSPPIALYGADIGKLETRNKLLNHQNAPSHLIGKIAANYPEHSSKAFGHKNFDSESLLHYGLASKDPDMNKIVSNKNFSPKIHSDFLNKSFTDDQIATIMKHPDYDSGHNRHFTVDKNSSPEVQKLYLKHIPTTSGLHEFAKKLDTNDESIAKEIVDHPHSTAVTALRMAKKFPNNEHIVGKLFNHPDSDYVIKSHIAKKSSNPNIQTELIKNHPTFENGKHDPIDMVGFEKHGASDNVRKMAKDKLIKDYGKDSYAKVHDMEKDNDFSDFKK